MKLIIKLILAFTCAFIAHSRADVYFYNNTDQPVVITYFKSVQVIGGMKETYRTPVECWDGATYVNGSWVGNEYVDGEFDTDDSWTEPGNTDYQWKAGSNNLSTLLYSETVAPYTTFSLSDTYESKDGTTTSEENLRYTEPRWYGQGGSTGTFGGYRWYDEVTVVTSGSSESVSYTLNFP